MIIDFDHNPALTTDQKLQSLKESMQMAVDEMTSAIELLKKEVRELKQAIGD